MRKSNLEKPFLSINEYEFDRFIKAFIHKQAYYMKYNRILIKTTDKTARKLASNYRYLTYEDWSQIMKTVFRKDYQLVFDDEIKKKFNYYYNKES